MTQSRSKDIVLGGSVMGLTCQDFITCVSWVTIFFCEVVWVLGILQWWPHCKVAQMWACGFRKKVGHEVHFCRIWRMWASRSERTWEMRRNTDSGRKLDAGGGCWKENGEQGNLLPRQYRELRTLSARAGTLAYPAKDPISNFISWKKFTSWKKSISWKKFTS